MLTNSLLEILYVLCGLVCFYSTYSTLKDKNHKSRIPTALFWGILGFIFAFSKIGLIWGNKNIFVSNTIIGYLVILLAVLSALKSVKYPDFKESTEEFKSKMSDKIGNKIFLPAISLALLTVFIAQIWSKQIGTIVPIGIAAILSSMLALFITKGSSKDMMCDGRRLLEVVGPINILPQLLAALGSVFTIAGVGNVISSGIGTLIPKGNILLGVIAYCLGMAIFTIIMGNAFAAFSVITAGIGLPFLLSQGGNPIVIGALGLTAGYCGTLLTPMAANFNIVPTAILEMKDKKYGVIKHQAPVAITMLIIHIILMYFWAF